MADNVNNFNNFTQLSSKITQLLHGKSLNNRNLIKQTIDELNSINYRYPIIRNPTKAVLLINQCCTLIPPEDQQLADGYCKLLKTLINFQNIQIEGRTLILTINWCLEALKFNDNDCGEFEIISSLDCLLRMDKKHEALKNIVNNPKLINNLTKNDKLDIVLITLKCFEAAIQPAVDQKKPLLNDYDDVGDDEEFSSCFNIFLKQLIDYKNIENPKMIKILTICLLGLQHIALQKPKIINQNLSIIFGIIRSYICFGIVGINFIKPEKVLPTTLTIPEPVSYVADKKSGKAIKRRKQRNPAVDKRQNFHDSNDNNNDNDNNTYRPIYNINDEHNHMIKTSDSDYSQSDLENGENLTKLTMKLRQTALGLFMDIIKVGQKGVIFTYWSIFIPENSTSTTATNKHTLINCILKDPTSKGRLAALNTLLLLLTTSRLYLKQAEKGEHCTSFTPFSVVISNMLNELHKCLIMSLNEQYIPVLVQILKCFSALIQATPYHKLQKGLITSIIKNIKPLIYHRDSSVQVTSLIVLGYCLSIEPILLEIQDILIDDDYNNSDNNDDNKNLIRRKSWLIERCLLNLGIENHTIINNNLPTTVKMESLQLLSIIIRHYYHLFILSYIESINLCLLLSINDKYLDVRYHTLRTIDSISRTINLKLLNNNDDDDDNNNNCLIIREKMLDLWEKLLEKSLIDSIQSEQYPNLRTASCDCLGSIGGVIFEKLPRDKQILCITLLFNCTHDQDDCVRSTCVRTLGLLILYPILRDDYGFIMDTMGMFFNLLNDKNLSVRIKTSWSLANLCEALVLNKLDLNTNEEFPKKLLLKLLKSINSAINDNDRIKMNIVRAIGSLLQLITEDLINNNDFIVEIQQNIENLIKCCSTGSIMKVRWNSCYALKNMMKNPILFTTNFNWQENVFNTLIDLAMNFRNFKVRICATSALNSPTNRLYYDQYYVKIWNGLCKALENAENMEDFSEYNHRDHLVDEICLTIGHLITLLTIDDLLLIQECINLNYENLKRQIQKVWDRLLPEKIAILFKANQHINDLLLSLTDDKRILKQEQKYVLQQIQDIIKQDF